MTRERQSSAGTGWRVGNDEGVKSESPIAWNWQARRIVYGFDRVKKIHCQVLFRYPGHFQRSTRDSYELTHQILDNDRKCSRSVWVFQNRMFHEEFCPCNRRQAASMVIDATLTAGLADCTSHEILFVLSGSMMLRETISSQSAGEVVLRDQLAKRHFKFPRQRSTVGVAFLDSARVTELYWTWVTASRCGAPAQRYLPVRGQLILSPRSRHTHPGDPMSPRGSRYGSDRRAATML